ncbi:MAG: matrixin family metalloprotease [Bacillota bacterium]
MFDTVASTWWDDLFGRLYDCDTKFDSDEIWNTDVTRPPTALEEDAWSVAAHEFGHWLSLGHSYSSPDDIGLQWMIELITVCITPAI